MKKIFLLSSTLLALTVSCKKYENVSQPLDYSKYQSSIDTTFNYLEDIKDWEGISNISE